MKYLSRSLILGMLLLAWQQMINLSQEQPKQEEPAQCRLVFYRMDGGGGSSNPIVYLDEIPLAKLTKHKFFSTIVLVSEGPATVMLRTMGAPSRPLIVKPMAWETIYVKVIGPSLFGRGGPLGNVVVVGDSDAEKALKKCKPEETKNVHDEKRVILDPDVMPKMH